jgi:hypothetical protein
MLTTQLDADFNEQSGNFFFVKKLPLDMANEDNWDRAADWMIAETERYEAALKNVFAGKPQ